MTIEEKTAALNTCKKISSNEQEPKGMRALARIVADILQSEPVAESDLGKFIEKVIIDTSAKCASEVIERLRGMAEKEKSNSVQ